MTLPTLLAALAVLGVPRPPAAGDPAPLRAVVLAATRAVEGDSTAALRTRWGRAASDPASQLGLATLDRLRYDYDAADRRYRALLASAADPAVRRYAELGLARGLATRWQRDSAVPHLQRVLDGARRAGDVTAELEALFALVRLEARRLPPDSIDLLLRRAEAIAPRANPDLVASVHCARAAWLRPGDPVRADSVVGLGLAAARGATLRRVEAGCLFVRGTILVSARRGDEAATALREAVRAARAARDLELLSPALQWLGNQLAQFSPDVAEGRRTLLEAIDASTRCGSIVTRTFAQLNLAQLAIRLGDASAAVRMADEAEVLLARLGDARGIAGTQFVRAEAAMLSGRPGEAYAHYEQAAQQNGQLGLVAFRANLVLAQAAALRELGQPGPAREHLDRAETLMRATGTSEAIVAVTYERALQALATGRTREALDGLARVERQTGARLTHFAYDVRMRRAEALARSGRFDAAERELGAAASLLDGWRRSIGDRDVRLALLGSRRIDYDPGVGLATTVSLLAGAGRVLPALRAAEARRGLELWQQTARRAALAGLSAAASEREMADPRMLPAELPDSTALLVYVTGRGGEPTTLFVATRAGVTAHKLAAADSLVAPIERLLRLLESGARADALRRRLGDALLGPALAAIGPGVTRLVVVPDGPIHRVPLDALLLAGGVAAVDRFEVAVSPSVRIARRWWRAPAGAGRPGVLAFADPAYAPASGLPRLAASAREGEAAADAAADGRLLVRGAASEAALKRARLRGLGILHLATHARVEDRGLLASALYLAPGGGEDGRVGPEEIAALSLDTDLVVLSGCRTAGGVITTGEGVQGLAAPFLEAGARAVAATYWEVGDRAMASLMTRFYGELAGGRSIADALRRAKLAARRDGAAPAIWASMTLIGDPGLRPRLGRDAARGG